jgi:hypothetical protein
VKAEHLCCVSALPEQYIHVDVRKVQVSGGSGPGASVVRDVDCDHRVHNSYKKASKFLAPGLHGLLHKRGYWRATWKPRYFVQTALGDLEYFEVENSMPQGEAIGVIPIAMPAGRKGSDNETVVRSAGREAGHHLMEVRAKGEGPARGRTIMLGAESDAERDRWVSSLRTIAEAWRSPPTARTGSGGRAPSSWARTPSPAAPPAASCRRRTPSPEQPRRAASSEPRAQPTSPTGSTAPAAARQAALTRCRAPEPGAEDAAGGEGAVRGDTAARGRPRSGGAAAAASPRAAIEAQLEGMLWKRGRRSPAWTERRFVLTARGDLEYYRPHVRPSRVSRASDATSCIRHLTLPANWSKKLGRARARGAPQGGPPPGVIPVALRAGCRGEEEGTVVAVRRRAGGRDRRWPGVIELTVRMAGPACGRTYVLRAAARADHERWAAALRRAAGAWREEGRAVGPGRPSPDRPRSCRRPGARAPCPGPSRPLCTTGAA